MRSGLLSHTLRGLTRLLDPGGEGLLEVLVLLECDGGAHLGGQHHLGSRGHLARQRAHDDFRGGGGRGGGPRGSGKLRMVAFLKVRKTVDSRYRSLDFSSL